MTPSYRNLFPTLVPAIGPFLQSSTSLRGIAYTAAHSDIFNAMYSAFNQRMHVIHCEHLCWITAIGAMTILFVYQVYDLLRCDIAAATAFLSPAPLIFCLFLDWIWLAKARSRSQSFSIFIFAQTLSEFHVITLAVLKYCFSIGYVIFTGIFFSSRRRSFLRTNPIAIGMTPLCLFRAYMLNILSFPFLKTGLAMPVQAILAVFVFVKHLRWFNRVALATALFNRGCGRILHDGHSSKVIVHAQGVSAPLCFCVPPILPHFELKIAYQGGIS